MAWKLDPNTEKQWKPIISGLYELLYNNKEKVKSLPGFEYVKDLGVLDFPSIGEARKFEVSYKGTGYALYIHFYNRDNGNCLAITNELNGRNLLHLVLDSYLEGTPSGTRIWHDGKITGIANLTSEKLITYVKRKEPSLIKTEPDYGDYVEFGIVDEKEKLSFSNPKILKLFSNLILFGILRHEIKKDFKAEDFEEDDINAESDKKFLLVNITWNSKDWQETSEDKSNHRHVVGGGVPHESWNFDFNNPRNTEDFIYGYAQFTNTPTRVKGDNNLLIFYSQNKIVGFYGKAKIISEAVEVNEVESYNLIGSRPLCVLLNNKIDDAKEKGYLEDKQRVGQTGFTYLEKESTIEKILNEAINLNPDKKKILESIKDWAFNNSRRYTPEEIKEMFTSYLNERGPQSSDKYISSIEGKVSEWCRKHKFVGETVYEKYLPTEVDEMFNKLGDLEDIRINKNTFFTPMNWYRDFCDDLAAKGTNVSYWIFQANPTKVYRIVDALKAGVLNSWMVNQYSKEIKKGDKVILWVTGEIAGVYALATITSDISIFNNEEEREYYIDKSQITPSERVSLRMDHNLVARPIFKEEVLNNSNLSDLNQGRAGTNFPATKLQYETILHLINSKPMDSNNHNPLNQILFGPPGTGKTYHTISEAIKIVDSKYYEANSQNREKLQERFNELLIKDWVNPSGQIAFCTFHQSFSYEDFVEGIKPKTTKTQQVYYEIEDGIFKSICRHADAINNAKSLVKDNLISFSQAEFNTAIFYKVSLGDSTKAEDKEIYNYCINNNCIAIGFGDGIDFSGKDETEVNEIVAENKLDAYTASQINYFKNYLKVGDYVVISNGNSYIRALGKVTGEYEFKENGEIRYDHFRNVEWLFSDRDIPVNEFYSKGLQQKTIYKLKSEFIIPEFFVRETKRAEVKDEQKNFVIIIDEINRGNVSSIFGELITLIEPTKRATCPEELSVVLPYSKTQFKVPSNVFVVGTMNTADRSIESLDTALRRRFSFKEMSPKSEIIKTEGISKGVVEGINLVSLLDRINERIEKLIDKDHKIGHSYFISVNSLPQLKLAFNDKVIPLLEEYFFGDFGKIGLVLGSSFVKKEVNDFDFATFTDYDSQTEQDLKQRAVYKIKPHAEWDFKRIYEAKPKQ